ncbi:FtsW/RodA/SpoVE family cell cycle protein [Bacillus pumilus]|uniref:FtsW/RodA/SpoVE family cell cycle protein n=1 Tax=Bacillus pumilus TaxID=1408 RepID=UPI001B3A6D6E|nr:FtsW/RodA/SpoVE family cell cycle protein [Bacillus pumilus]MBQ4815214.1 FtsW/RodA/SpoVE family cell cycle protein [Bacillus pumilus]WIG31014.1 FtsW/RodA/SpoVE family cell cycle protein [Bacillus pumilus]
MGLEKKFEKYMKNVCKRVKNKDVHSEIKLELMDHLYTLKEEAMNAGMSEEEAVDQALEQIGDAAILGAQLHETHKTQMDIKMILLVLAACSCGLLVMYFLQFHSEFTTLQGMNIFYKSLAYYLIGLVLLFILFTFDYRRLLSYSWHLYIGTLAMVLLTMIFGIRVNGVLFLRLSDISINLTEVVPFLVIVSLAGIFHSWNWENDFKAWLGVGLMTLPVMLISTIGFLPATIICFVMCLTMMYASSARLSQIIPLAAAGGVYLMFELFSHLQAGRHIYTVHEFSSNGLQIIPSAMSEVHTDWMFTYVIFSFGWLAGVVVLMLFVIFIYRIFHTTKRVKMAYGKMLMTGFAAVFATKLILSIATNFGLLPFSGLSMPFMSYGGSHILLELMAVGLILSIYRRRKMGDVVIQEAERIS